MITIIIPACNEQGYIGDCLAHILSSQEPPAANTPVQVLVVANGCSDDTAKLARGFAPAFADRGWQFEVAELARGSKTAALNAGDAAAINGTRAYVDADIRVSPGLIAELAIALNRLEPAYASGRPTIRTATSVISERYARFWEQLPFMASGVPGCGVYAVNAAGRARWGPFPDIISDDSFVRCHFAPDEMHAVAAPYSWPVTEGFRNLVRVRRRQDEGLAELRNLLPDLAGNTADTSPTIGQKLRLLRRDPLGMLVYATVALTVRTPLFANNERWQRGR